MCYPDSVLFHVRLRGLSDDDLRVLARAPGMNCRLEDDGIGLLRMEFANPVPSWPDVDAFRTTLMGALRELVPDAEIADVRHGFRYAPDTGSPAAQALRRLRADLARVPTRDELDAEGLAELLTIVAREFSALDTWLCNGGSIPKEWARRHPEGDLRASEELAILDNPYSVLPA